LGLLVSFCFIVYWFDLKLALSQMQALSQYFFAINIAGSEPNVCLRFSYDFFIPFKPF